MRFKEDNLEKLVCLNCEESIIVGETAYRKHSKNVKCPYCFSEMEAIVGTTDECLTRMNLGCMAILKTV